MSAGLPTDSCFTGAVARSFSLPVLYRRKHDWKYCLNAITKQIGTAAYVVSITEAWMTPTTLLVISFLVCKTQLPYALTCAAIGCIGYLIIGLTL